MGVRVVIVPNREDRRAKLMSRNVLLLSISGWLILTAVVGLAAVCGFDIPKYLKLQKSGQMVKGSVIAWNESDRIIQYEYSVGDNKYYSEFHANKGTAYMGMIIEVTYLPTDPSYHLVGPFGENLQARIILGTIMMALPTILGLGVLVFAFNRQVAQVAGSDLHYCNTGNKQRSPRDDS